MTQGYSNFVSQAGKLLWLNSTIWNSAWLINIKNETKNQSKFERYLDIFKGKEIKEKISNIKLKGVWA